MHYCQACPEQQPMSADGGVARCPRCGRTDPASRIGPLFLVTGASGAGKTTLLPLLLERLAGECVVFDVDWLIDPLERASSDGIDWSVFRDLWLHVAHGVTQSGLDPVLLGPLFPQQLDEVPGRAWIGDTHTIVLDCPDDVRRARIESRPGWRARDVEEQTSFGHWLRENFDTVDTAAATPEAAADAVAAWVRALR